MGGYRPPVKRTVLFVFAHQDDEMAMAHRIRHEGRHAARVICTFLTKGAEESGGAARDTESRTVLERLGVAPHDIFFFGTELGIADGALVRRLADALRVMDQQLAGVSVDAMYGLLVGWA